MDNIPRLSETINNKSLRLKGAVSNTETVTGSLSSYSMKGDSAYDVAVKNGFEGTEEEWLASLQNYELMNNKPSINKKELVGDLSLSDIGAQSKGDYLDSSDIITNEEIMQIFQF